MSNLQTYEELVRTELKRGLINRNSVTEKEMKFLADTERQLDEFISELNSNGLVPLMPFLSQSVKDVHLISIIQDGINSRTISRYPLGWGDKVELYQNIYKLPSESSLELWYHQKFSMVFTEFSNLPEIEFVSLGHYMTFIISLILGEYNLAANILQHYDSFRDTLSTLCSERKQTLKQKRPLLLFYLFKGSSVKISKCPGVKKALMETAGYAIITGPTNEFCGAFDGENDFGNILTIQREVIGRLNLL